MRDIIDQLGQLRSRGRMLLLAQRGAVLLASILAAVLFFAAVDYLLRFPGGFRLVLLLAGLGAAGWYALKHLIPTLGFNPSLTDLALRVERALPAVAGRLASSVEFAVSGVDQANPLAARSVSDTQSRLAGESMAGIINPKRTRRDLLAFTVVALIAVIVTLSSPAFATTALSRLFLPLGSAEWPARTGVVSLIDEITVHPRGLALPLRARATKGDFETMEVSARYRLERNGEWGSWRTIVLARQPGQGPDLFESLVDTEAERIEVAFFTDDARTPMHEIAFVPPPAVVRASLTVTPPAYASGRYPTVETELGTGLDARAIAETPVLIGSDARVDFVFNKPIVVRPDDPAWTRTTFTWAFDAPPQVIYDESTPEALSLRWRVEETTRLTLHLEDANGIANSNDIVYRVDAVSDRMPSVTITRPESDEVVTPTAVVGLTAEARDDVAVGRIGLEARRQAAPGSEEAAPLLWEQVEAVDTVAALMERDLDLATIGAREGDVIEVTALADDMYALDGETHETARSAIRRLRIVSALDFQTALREQLTLLRQNAIRIEGQQAELQDDVIDDGVQPGIARAQGRISERLADQVSALEEINRRREANRIDDAQLEQLLRDSLDLLTEAGRASNDASQRIETRERTMPNQDGQPANQQGEAGQPGQPNEQGEQGQPGQNQQGQQGQQDQQGQPEGQQGQNQPGEQQPGEDQPPTENEQSRGDEPEWGEAQPEDQPIVDAQQRVRDELGDLISLLDRNEDTWVINQQLQALLEEQQQLRTDTQRLRDQTLGRDLSELTELELSELDRIAMRQRELEEEASNLIEESRERAQDLESVDPQAAQGLRDAADTAQREELERNMQEASQQAQQNQLQNAQQSQQQAIDTLQRMQERMNQDRAQTQELQRRLESLVDSIKRLVTVQENEINALAEAVFQENFAGRDRAMIRLQQNTQAVGGEARAAGPRAARVARAIDRAADAQGAAIGALRATPVESDRANEAEERSLELLKEALTEAEALQEQLEEEEIRQQREALMEGYRQLIEQQVALRGDTVELAEQQPLDRRGLVEARRFSTLEEDIRRTMDQLRRDNEDVANSMVFNHVHDLVDGAAMTVRDDLRDGKVGVLVTDRQQFIADAIGRLLQALEEEQQDDNPFEDGQQGSEGGQQGGGQPGEGQLIPPIAELKLLRGLQEQIYELTRQSDARSDLDAAARRETLRDLGQRQRELHDLGQRVIEQMQQQGGGAQPRPGGGDGGPPPGEAPNQAESAAFGGGS